MLTTFMVNTLVDENGTYAPGGSSNSLREAIAYAATQSGPDTIEFDSSLMDGVIELTHDQLAITSDVTIVGLGMDLLTIDAQGNSRVFLVSGGKTASMSGLTITGGSADYGGGLLIQGSLQMDSVRVEHNLATAAGGGMLVSGSLNLNSSIVSHNKALHPSGNYTHGGGMHINSQASSVTIHGSTFDDNEAYFGGAIHTLLKDGEIFTIENSTLSNNRAVGTAAVGGGLFLQDAAPNLATAKIINSTISSNTGTHSGGIRLHSSKIHLDLVNSTVAYNKGNESGGLHLSLGGTATLHNTIVAENKNLAGNTDSNLSYGNVDSSSSYNLIGPGGSGGLTNGTNGNIVFSSGQSAGLAPLGDFGGPTWTHALLAGSPAIDKGSNAKALDANGDPLTADQRGSTRPVDVGTTGPTGGTVDIGAFEFSFTTPLVVSTLADTIDGRYGTGELSLREALSLANLNPGIDTITFDASLYANGPATIALAYDGNDSGIVPDQLYAVLVTIQGPGADKLIISGGGQQTRVMLASNATIEGVTITGGIAATGGGLWAVNSTLRKSRVTGNTATYNGGGIYSYGDFKLIDSEVSENIAGSGGGGVFSFGAYERHAVLKIVNSTISGNDVTSATGRGGGLYTSQYNGDYDYDLCAAITNSTISGNSAKDGGGIFAHHIYGPLQLSKVHNSIIAGNVDLANLPDDIAGDGLDLTSSYNLIGSVGSGGLTNGGTYQNIILASGQTAGLAPLDFYGGTTKTHALLAGSPAIDKGSNAKAVDANGNALTFDQRGSAYDRILGEHVDIGATEAHVLLREDGTLEVYGTQLDDAIELNPDGVTIDRIGTFAVDVMSASAIHVEALAGNDGVSFDSRIAAPASIAGGSGDDTLRSGAGPDSIEGGDGDDRIFGGDGNDEIAGGAARTKSGVGLETISSAAATATTPFSARKAKIRSRETATAMRSTAAMATMPGSPAATATISSMPARATMPMYLAMPAMTSSSVARARMFSPAAPTTTCLTAR